MAVNKVDFGGNTLIDLTGDTLDSAEQLLKGIIAHAKDGSQIVGALEAGGGGNVLVGSFTPSKDVRSFEITHNLGTIPTFACWTLSDKNSSVGFAKNDALAGVAWGNTTTQLNIYNGNNSPYIFTVALEGKFLTSSAITYGIAGNGVAWAIAKTNTIYAVSEGYFRAGKTYQYIILGE